MRLLTPLAARLLADNLDRETVEYVQQSGFVNLQVESLATDVIKLMRAENPTR